MAKRQSMTVADLRRIVAEFDAQEDVNEGEYVVLQDEYGAESELSGGVIVNGVLFLIPDRAFEDEGSTAVVVQNPTYLEQG